MVLTVSSILMAISIAGCSRNGHTYQDPQTIAEGVFTAPATMAFDLSEGELYVADPARAQVVRVKEGRSETFITLEADPERRVDIRVDDRHYMYTLDQEINGIRITRQDGESAGGLGLDAERYGLVQAIEIAPEGNVFLGTSSGVYHSSLEGEFVRQLTDSDVESITYHEGSLYLVNKDAGNKLHRYDRNGTLLGETTFDAAVVGKPAVNPLDHKLYVWTDDHRLLAVGANGDIDYIAYENEALDVRGMAFDASGDLYFMDGSDLLRLPMK